MPFSAWNDWQIVRRLIVLICDVSTYKFIRRRMHTRGLGVVCLFGLCIKIRPRMFSNIPEAHTTEWVRKNTTIPVPRVYMAFDHGIGSYLVMERVKGEAIAYSWGDQSEEYQTTILSQLAEIVQKLRALEPPPGVGVCNASGGPIQDPRLPAGHMGTPYFGPYESVKAFHKAIRNDFTMDEDLTDREEIAQIIEWHDTVSDEPVFTHGDLSSFNIMADGDRVTGIIDWETSGWLPDYWEYVTARMQNPYNLWWGREVPKFMTALPHANKMNELRKDIFGRW